MEKTILPLLYFGTIKWFALFLQGQGTEIEAHENFQKQTYRNRMRILSANGPLDLIVPVKNKNSKAGIQNMAIYHEQNWAWQHYHGLLSAYRKAPYFEYYQSELESFYQEAKELNLWEINIKAFNLINKWLNLNANLCFTASFKLDYPAGSDYRTKFKPAKNSDPIVAPPYLQVFSDRFSFVPDLSILDLLFNLGPESEHYLKQIKIKPTVNE